MRSRSSAASASDCASRARRRSDSSDSTRSLTGRTGLSFSSSGGRVSASCDASYSRSKSSNSRNIATNIVSVGGKTRIDFAIIDGGAFDADGIANGIIVDPGAIGSMPLSMVGATPVSTGTGFWF